MKKVSIITPEEAALKVQDGEDVYKRQDPALQNRHHTR